MVHTALGDFSHAIRNDNTDSIDDCQQEEASNQNEHCYQVLFGRLCPAKKDNWTAREQKVDRCESAPKAIPGLLHDCSLRRKQNADCLPFERCSKQRGSHGANRYRGSFTCPLSGRA
jgi:hypothetical protein